MIDPDDYPCEWTIFVKKENNEPEMQKYPGTLKLFPSISPSGTIIGFKEFWEIDSISGQMSRSLPNAIRYPELRCRLIDRPYEVILFDVVVSDSFGGEAVVVDGGAAIVGVDLPAGDSPKFMGIEIQVTALDAIGGRRPLASSTAPAVAEEWRSGEWSAKGNGESGQRWADDEVEVRHEYDTTARVYDPYEFRVRFSPVLRVNRTTPKDLGYWIDTWVNPLRTIISAATGREETITYVYFLGDLCESGTPDSRAQLFAKGISQTFYYSSDVDVRAAQIAFNVATDGLSLLDVVKRWNAEINAGNPLLQTYNPLMMAAQQHPRGKFLYTMQCLEGLDGFERRLEFDKKLRGHRRERFELIQNLKDAKDLIDSPITAGNLKFAKSAIGGRPSESLASCLGRMISKVPAPDIEITTELSKLHIISDIMLSESAPDTILDAVRIIRNDLAHGNRDYPPRYIDEVAQVFYRLVRAHLLRYLGCSESAQKSALSSDR
ncbi:hypothetical protein B7C42_00118 [Nocardia cerradoensis]|uniref:Uncharacterized protein n=2 Tax=Nocardia cerradoensis TaxID=85688 RepID=A0A231HDK9_9NOCA|nr:hypothetical protein B7C42_00118 [Nocardia cerradoensis]